MEVRRVGVVVAIAMLAGIVRSAYAGVPASVLAGSEQRLAASFAARGIVYPPRTVALVALKAEARLEVWAGAGPGWTFVRSYLVRSSSGRLGPKLRQGDHQVPEGVYRLDLLNPDSRYHLSMRIDYPNAFDRARARDDGRARLGGDIMIHGDSVSDGCLPVGDAAVEELFALTARVGLENVVVIVSPMDLRRVDSRVALARVAGPPRWLRELYTEITSALKSFPLPPDHGVPVVSSRRPVVVVPKPGPRRGRLHAAVPGRRPGELRARRSPVRGRMGRGGGRGEGTSAARPCMGSAPCVLTLPTRRRRAAWHPPWCSRWPSRRAQPARCRDRGFRRSSRRRRPRTAAASATVPTGPA